LGKPNYISQKFHQALGSWLLVLCFSFAIVEAAVGNDQILIEQTDDCSTENEVNSEKELEDKMVYGLTQIENDLSTLFHHEEVLVHSFDQHYEVLTPPPEFF